MLPNCLALALAVEAATLSAGDAAARTDLVPRANAQAITGWHNQSVPAATNRVVTSCADDGTAGTLRYEVGQAVSGDSIDMSALTCSTITLATGAGGGQIGIGVADLTIVGPPAGTLAISAANTSRVFWHNYSGSSSNGTLTLRDLTIENGKKYLANGATLGQAAGGCVFSYGTVQLDTVFVVNCKADSADSQHVAKGGGVYARQGLQLQNSVVNNAIVHSSASHAYGGGVYTQGALLLDHSRLIQNEAYTTTINGGYAKGGGAQVGALYGTGHVPGGLTSAKYSTIANNSATKVGVDSSGLGGGLYLTGDAIITSTTISGNISGRGGGLCLNKGASNVSQPWTIVNSTVSGNRGLSEGVGNAGGIAVRANPIHIANSTIAFNWATSTSAGPIGAGLQLNGATADLQSVIIANNGVNPTTLPTHDDVGSVPPAPSALTGANNLIYATSLPAPPGTWVLDPKLKPLSYNGGPTETHALDPTSPAINAGNNAANNTYDQRGTGHPRVGGAAADIGAFEFDFSDFIFANGFD
jgi:hypothetical protein